MFTLVGWFVRNCLPPSKRRRVNQRRLLIEALEPRWVPSGVVAQDDTYYVIHDRVLQVDAATGVLANDQGNNLTVSGYSTASPGQVSVNADGSFALTPPPAYTGQCVFQYTATDGSDSATATVTVFVTNQAPVAYDQEYQTLHDQTLSVDASQGLLSNAYDPDGDALTIVNYAQPASGTGSVTVNQATGAFTYTPPTGYTGQTGFTVAIGDGITTTTATVYLDVTNQAPIAYDQEYQTLHDQSLRVGASQGLLSQAYDPDGDALTIVSYTQPPTGTGSVTVNQTTGAFSYTPPAAYTGQTSFTVAIGDGITTTTATVYLDVTNQAPIAYDQEYQTLHDQTLSVDASQGLLSNAYDPDGDALTIVSYTQPPTGTGSVMVNQATGAFTYAPAAGYTGQTSFTVTIGDGITATTATVYLDVTNQAPIAYDQSYQAFTNQPLVVDASQGMLSQAYDPDGDALSIVSYTQPTAGTGSVRVDPTTGAFTYTAAAGYTGETSFTVAIGDGITTTTATAWIAVAAAPAAQVWTVNAPTDTGAGNMATLSGDLRFCVTNAQNGDTIKFNIPGGGVQQIALTKTLPVNVSVTIDATTQPGYNGQPVVQINGAPNTIAGDALNVTAANVTVKGLSIINFVSGAAVDLTNANGGCIIQADYLGVFPNGQVAGANQYGVEIVNSAGNTITQDVISGNFTGVWIQGTSATLNSVTASYIGTDFTGTNKVPNGNPANPTGSGVGDGVYIVTSASANTIGGDYFTQQNVISGNLKNGVEIDFQSNGNYVQGNLIGLSATGAALGNGGDGVHVFDASNNNVIGGGSGTDENGQFVSYGNVISANTGNGIRIDHTTPYPGPSGTKILGNYIGLGTDGATPQGNGQNGVLITDSPNTVIGDGAATDGNIISTNKLNGIEVDSTTGTKIFGNRIGTDWSGQIAEKIQIDGILISANQTQVGQAGASSLNVISGNTNDGVEIQGGDQNTIANNYIGVGADGSTALGNGNGGVAVEGNSTNTTIGGTSYDLGNVISDNQGGPGQGGGIELLGHSSYTNVAGNLIGTDASGTLEVPNANDGIFIEVNSTHNTIGLLGAFNFIYYNGHFGIEVDGSNNTIDCNYIGIDPDEILRANQTPPGWLDNGTGNYWGSLNFEQ